MATVARCTRPLCSSASPSEVLFATGSAESEIVVKKSRFVARVCALTVRASDHNTKGSDAASAARDAISSMSDMSATHNCWAWRYGEDSRSSDDGEPGGTAGRPILTAIDASGIDRVAVVVTRYYGGIKLGTGGLARAYGGAAAASLREVPTAEAISTRCVCVRCDAAESGAVFRHLSAFHGMETAYDSEGGVCVKAWVPDGQCDAIVRSILRATRDQATIDTGPSCLRAAISGEHDGA